MEMISRPVIITAPAATVTAKTAKNTLFQVVISVAALGSLIVGAILLLQGGLALGQFRYYIDIGQHPIHITSTIILILGLLSILAFISLASALIQINRKFALIAAGLLGFVSLGLIVLSIWSFTTLASGSLPASINNTLFKELEQTQYNLAGTNSLIVENTPTMARLEKQHQCCGLSNPVEDYRSRQPSLYGSSSSSSGGGGGGGGGSARGRTTNPQRNPSSVLLPISCCNEKYRSNENNLCLDVYGNRSEPLQRYNDEGCYSVITREKFKHIQRQGFTTVTTACLAVISSVALVAVLKLLAQGYQILPARRVT